MQYKTAAIFAVGLASSVAATGWLDEDAYSCPSNTDNQCTDSQQGGYDWSGLDDGSFDSYGSSSFSGFSCGNSYGKRDLLTKRTFQDKCIQGNLDEQPSMSCDSEDDRFSIDEMQISTSHDADIECEYSMPDGSTCRETHSCSSGGSIVKNSQCGGARSVTFKPGANAPSGCSVGVHSIGFNCNSASSSVPAASTPAPSTSSYVMTPGYTSRPAYTTSSAGCGYGDEDCSSSAVPSSPVSSSAPAPSCAYGDEGCEGPSSAPATTGVPGYTSCAYGESCESSAVPSSPVSSAPAESCAYGDEGCSDTPSSPITSSVPVETSSAPAPGCGGYGQPSCESSTQGESCGGYGQPACESSAQGGSCGGYGQPACESSTIATPGYTSKSSSTENSPVSSSIPAYGGSTSSAPGSPVTSSAPYPTSSTQGIPGYGTGSESSSTENSPVSSSSKPSYPEPSCPGVLPKCLKTWLHVSQCKDSADSDCFCKDATFIKNVHECLPAWADNEEASAAASYLMGLCAPHIPSNPGIITNCPSSITPVATPSYTQPASSAPASSAPVYSVSSASEWSPVGSSVPAEQPSSSPASPVESEAPPPAYTPKTNTYWSTAVVTITSCGPEVTNCPAGSTIVQTTSTPIVSVETSYPAETTPASTPYSPVTTSAAGSPPGDAPSSPAGPTAPGYATSSPAAPSAPGYTAPPAESAPVTTVTYSSSVIAPATYSTGVSQGYEIPDSSYTTQLITTVTVPMVQMTTSTITVDGQETTSVGLGAGGPAPASATPTADAVGGYGSPSGSAGWGTSYIPKPTQSGAPIEQVGNSGVKVGTSLAGLALGAVAAVMAF